MQTSNPAITVVLQLMLVVSLAVAQESQPAADENRNTRQAAQAAPVTAARYRAYGWLVPSEREPDLSRQRMLMVLPDGPLLVDTTMTIDGSGFRSYREATLRSILTAGDHRIAGLPPADCRRQLSAARRRLRPASRQRHEPLR